MTCAMRVVNLVSILASIFGDLVKGAQLSEYEVIRMLTTDLGFSYDKTHPPTPANHLQHLHLIHQLEVPFISHFSSFLKELSSFFFS